MGNKNLWVGIGLLLAVALVGGFLLLGRGQQVSTPSPEPISTPSEVSVEETLAPEAEVREIVIEGDEYSFSPTSLSFTAGERVRVTFRNNGNLPHNFTISELGVASRTIQPGQTDTIEFTVEGTGTYTSFCSVGNHRQLGMEGDVVVE